MMLYSYQYSLPPIKKYIGKEYKGGRLARGQYYAKLNKMTDVADNIIKTL